MPPNNLDANPQPNENQPEPMAGSVIQPHATQPPSSKAPIAGLHPAVANHPLFRDTPPAASPSVASAQAPPPKSRGRKKKLVLLLVPLLVLLIGGGAGAYFGYYVPNKPEN